MPNDSETHDLKEAARDQAVDYWLEDQEWQAGYDEWYYTMGEERAREEEDVT